MKRKEELLYKLSHFITKNSLLLHESISGLNLDRKKEKNTIKENIKEEKNYTITRRERNPSL